MKPPNRKPQPGQVWSRYSLDGKRRLTGYLIRRVDGDLITAEPVNSRNRVIGPRMIFDREFLTRYYLEPKSLPTGTPDALASDGGGQS